MKMDEEIGQKVLQQVMDHCIIPEITKGKNNGWLKEDFVLKKALIMLTPSGKHKIRFNEKANFWLEISRPERQINPGDLIYDYDVQNVRKIIPLNLPKNCGWFAVIFLGNRVIGAFDTNYNMDKIKEHFRIAREFYDSALENRKQNRLSPFFEECWAVAEILSACNFLSLGQDYGSHNINIKKMKNWADLGNIDIKFSKLLEKLNSLRSVARYVNPGNLEKENSQEIIGVLNEMFKFTEERFKPK